MWIIVGAVLAALGVISGAFGAHILKGTLTPELMETYETAVRYQMYHSLGLILIGILERIQASSNIHNSGWLLFLGTIFFSGSLYVLVFTNLKFFGAITPIGGLLMISGWILLAYGVYRL